MAAGSKAWVFGRSFVGIAGSNPAEAWMFFPGVKRPGSEVGHSRPASAKVKNVWVSTSASLIRLHDVDGETFIFIFYHIGVLCDGKSPSSHMIVPNIDCCVGP